MKASIKSRDERQFVILSKLAEMGPMNMLEIGFSASPQAIRNMAARGLVRVTVEMMDRGIESLEKEKLRRLRAKTNDAKEQRRAGGIF